MLLDPTESLRSFLVSALQQLLPYAGKNESLLRQAIATLSDPDWTREKLKAVHDEATFAWLYADNRRDARVARIIHCALECVISAFLRAHDIDKRVRTFGQIVEAERGGDQ